MQLVSVYNEVLWVWCQQYRKEIRYYVRTELDNDGTIDTSVDFQWSRECNESDWSVTIHNYYTMPTGELVVDADLRAELDAEATYYYPSYLMRRERCLETENGDIIRVRGYERRRECDDSVVYEERYVKNSHTDDYPVGQMLNSLDWLTKTRCYSCCGWSLE